MPNDQEVTRRVFLERLAAGALAGAALNSPARAQSNPGTWTPPATLNNPNILIVMVDEMRSPMWLNSSQMAQLYQTVLPNIMGRIQNNAYNFEQFFVNATACTASRSCLLTGLYTPQTAMYVNTGELTGSAPILNTAYPTWGQALPLLNPAYQGNVWWFGKWHLSNIQGSSPLAAYGFKTRSYPGGTNNADPFGNPNEGANGGVFNGQTWASDAAITTDFITWLQGQSAGSAPWCATVSLINPHDIGFAPGWLQLTNPFPSATLGRQAVYFPPLQEPASNFYSAQPSPWNIEDLTKATTKPSLQLSYLNSLTSSLGAVTDWVTFLNQYFWLQSLADQQVGRVLNALSTSPFAGNTIVIFLSDHGDFAGSHGLHTKGFAVYDETMRVPFYVQFPGQTGSIAMNQMCSGVDFFGLICDLATGGSGQWRLAYPDLANRQSMWSFLYNNSAETRVAQAPVGLPYILHTFDTYQANVRCHIACMRTATAKLAYYSQWNTCSIYPNTAQVDTEFYYYPTNPSEMGNDVNDNDPNAQQAFANHSQVFGAWGPPGSGIIGNELNAPLIATGNNGVQLSQAVAAARQAFFTYASSLNGTSACPGS